MTKKFRVVLANGSEDDNDFPGGGGAFDFELWPYEKRPKTKWFESMAEAEEAGTLLNYELSEGDLKKVTESGEVFRYESGEEFVLLPDMDDLIYSPADDQEIHRAKVLIELSGVRVRLVCGLDSGDLEKGFFYTTTRDGILAGNCYCSYCFNR